MFYSRKNCSFSAADLVEKKELIKNPARGFLELHSFSVAEEWNLEEIPWCIKEQHSLALVLLNLQKAANRNLLEQELVQIRDLLHAFRQCGVDLILRVVYDTEGKCMEREPALFSQVKSHAMQLAPILRENRDIILVVQGLMLGNWGEMHGSKFLKKEMMTTLAALFQKEAGVFVALRTPYYCNLLEKSGTLEPFAFYDDGIFGSETDLGTFASLEERVYLEKHSVMTLNGGEVVFSSFSPTAEEMVSHLRAFHFSYLNAAYDKRRLEDFGKLSYQGWNLYQYVEAHLGYRFYVKKVSLQRKRREETLIIQIENQGFAAAAFSMELFLIGEIDEKRVFQERKTVEEGSWQSGQTIQLCFLQKFPDNVRLYLTLYRKSNQQIILFANQADEAGRVFLGQIHSPESQKSRWGSRDL